jgi:transcriptional regulator with XRE-family HTH domain
VANDKRPTEFGYHLLSEMSAVGLKPAQLARLADTSGSTITRLVYGGVSRPDSDTLAKLARALIQAGPEVVDFDKAVEDKHNDLLHAAGYRLGVAPPPVVLHPLVVELQQMIGEGSPLVAGDVHYLTDMVDRLVEPYRRKTRRRSA